MAHNTNNPALDNPKKIYRTRRYHEYEDVLAAIKDLGLGGGGNIPNPPDDDDQNLYGIRDGDWEIIPEAMPLVPSAAGEEDVLWVARNKRVWVKLDAVIKPKYTHTQGPISREWVINHNLATENLKAIVIDTTGYTRMEGGLDLTRTTNNRMVLLFAKPVAGKAFIKE